MYPRQCLTLSDGSILTRQEQFVLRQVAAGEIADLRQEFGEAEEERRLRARFLEELLTGELKGVEIHRRGIQINNAVVEDGLGLENGEVSADVGLNSFIFKESVRFRDAYFKDDLSISGSHFLKEANFHHLKVVGNLLCQDTTFAGPVDFVGADIKEHFSGKGAKFLSGDGKANFNGMQVGQDAVFKGCEFHGPVDFSLIQIAGSFHVGPDEKDILLKKTTIFRGSVNFGGARIGVQLGAQRVRFLAENQQANFNGMQVGRSAFFDNAEFHGQVDFINADIRGLFVAKGAKFLSKNLKANFAGMQVGQDARFDESEFHGPVDFVVTDIKRQFIAVGAKFLASNHKVDFYRMQVGQDASFQGCDFHGIVSFVLIKITGDLHLEPLLKTGVEMSTTFRGGVNFRGAEIGGELLANKAQFLGHIVNFEAVQVGRSFHASGALFAGTVNFAEMVVKSNFYINPFGRIKFSKTLFKGSANFSRLEVDGVLNANLAIFQSESVIFSGLKVGLTAFFNGTIFFGGLVLKEGQLNDLEISGLHKLSKGGLRLDEIVLNRTKIGHRLTIKNIEVKRFEARNLEVQGPTEFSRIVIKAEADFRDAALHHLQMVEVDWPEPRDGKAKVFLDGLTYESITTRAEPDKPEDWQKLFAWLSLSRFNTQNYGQLEDYLQRGGNKARADEAFIRGKRRAWRRRRWWSPGKYGLLLFWDWLAGYGRKPGRIFWVSLAIILIGACTFEPQFQEVNGWLAQLHGQHPWIARFFLSLDRFLPRPDTGLSNMWSLANFSTFACIWWQVQRICGWILIPIGLAAVYTRLK